MKISIVKEHGHRQHSKVKGEEVEEEGDVEHIEASMYKLAKDEILTCCSKAIGDIELSFKEKVNIFQSAYALNI